jgi:curved DNA-binding protein CbpA
MKLKEDASQQEVKKNFHRLAMFYHPDRNRGLHQEKFKLINEAYQVLSDKEMREEYDRIRVPEDDTEEAKKKWQKVEREDQGWESYQENPPQKGPSMTYMIVLTLIGGVTLYGLVLRYRQLNPPR